MGMPQTQDQFGLLTKTRPSYTTFSGHDSDEGELENGDDDTIEYSGIEVFQCKTLIFCHNDCFSSTSFIVHSKSNVSETKNYCDVVSSHPMDQVALAYHDSATVDHLIRVQNSSKYLLR